MPTDYPMTALQGALQQAIRRRLAGAGYGPQISALGTVLGGHLPGAAGYAGYGTAYRGTQSTGQGDYADLLRRLLGLGIGQTQSAMPVWQVLARYLASQGRPATGTLMQSIPSAARLAARPGAYNTAGIMPLPGQDLTGADFLALLLRTLPRPLMA